MDATFHQARPWSLSPEHRTSQVVTALQEYTQHTNAGKMTAFSESLATQRLSVEVQLLEALVQRNRNQHRNTAYFQRLQHVMRLLSLLYQTELPQAFQDMAAIMQKPIAQTPGDHRCKVSVPSREAGLLVILRLRGAVNICTQLTHACLHACEALLAQVAASFFMPMCLTCAALCSRLRVSASDHLIQCVDCYNRLLPCVGSLPSTQAAPAPVDSTLPSMVHITWLNGLPVIKDTCFESGTSFETLAQDLSEQFEVMQSVRSLAAPSTRGGRTTESAAWELATDAQNGPTLMLYEDRGSRAKKSTAATQQPKFNLAFSKKGCLSLGRSAALSNNTRPTSAAESAALLIVKSRADALPDCNDQHVAEGRTEEVDIHHTSGGDQLRAHASDSVKEADEVLVTVRKQRGPTSVDTPTARVGKPAAYDWRALLKEQQAKAKEATFVSTGARRGAVPGLSSSQPVQQAPALHSAIETTSGVPMATFKDGRPAVDDVKGASRPGQGNSEHQVQGSVVPLDVETARCVERKDRLETNASMSSPGSLPLWKVDAAEPRADELQSGADSTVVVAPMLMNRKMRKRVRSAAIQASKSGTSVTMAMQQVVQSVQEAKAAEAEAERLAIKASAALYYDSDGPEEADAPPRKRQTFDPHAGASTADLLLG